MPLSQSDMDRGRGALVLLLPLFSIPPVFQKLCICAENNIINRIGRQATCLCQSDKRWDDALHEVGFKHLIIEVPDVILLLID